MYYIHVHIRKFLHSTYLVNCTKYKESQFSIPRKLLGAACERKSVFLFDPITRRMISHVSNAHEDSVNCICFLDNRLFATCSGNTSCHVSMGGIQN